MCTFNLYSSNIVFDISTSKHFLSNITLFNIDYVTYVYFILYCLHYSILHVQKCVKIQQAKKIQLLVCLPFSKNYIKYESLKIPNEVLDNVLITSDYSALIPYNVEPYVCMLYVYCFVGDENGPTVPIKTHT